MVKRIVYTKITALPSNVPRQLALDMLHSHEEVIKLNPLVTGVKAIEAPRDARPDEFFSNWYEISEVITWGPGLRKKIAFKGVFHSQPWGMQSHVYAPMGVDMRNKYRIGGNQPGEPREARELGVNTPLDGLYLREDVEISCSVPLTSSFVKKEAQAATGIMIDRLTRKAELLDEGKLHAMFQDGMLKTAKPSDEPTFSDRPVPSPTDCSSASPPQSPGLNRQSTYGTSMASPSPALDSRGYGRYHDITRHQSQRNSTYTPQYQQNGHQAPHHAQGGAELPGVPEIAEMPGDFHQPGQYDHGLYPPPLKASTGQGQVFRAELPGESTFIQQPQQPSSRPVSGSGQLQSHQAYQQPTSPLPNGQPVRAPSTGGNSTYSDRSGYNRHPQQQPPQQQYQSYRQGPNPGQGQFSPPPQQQHPAYRQSSQQSVSDWQRSLSGASAEDPNNIRNSVPSSGYLEPDHQRFSQMSLQSSQSLRYGPTNGSGKVSKCPVCELFEGDETAISHHVSKAHFA